MRKYTCFAVFEPNGKGGYGVYFPDLPGCVSHGEDFDHARAMAKEALGLHIYGMEKDGDEIPEPTSDPRLLDIDEDTAQGYLLSDVAVFPDIVRDRLDNIA